MERLTKRNDKGHVQMAIDCPNGCEYFFPGTIGEGPNCKGECEANAMIKLCDYEDAEEQGLLLRLPCKVGDEFWVIAYRSNVITHVKCSGYTVQRDIPNKIEQSYIWLDLVDNPKDYWKLSFEEFKDQCFKTQAEAEQALADKGV